MWLQQSSSVGETKTCAKCSSQDRSDTCPQFWRLVEQEDVKVVVMLCRVQSGFTGCSQYFPPREFDKPAQHGPFKIKTARALSHR